jgi:hypothetical protein
LNKLIWSPWLHASSKWASTKQTYSSLSISYFTLYIDVFPWLLRFLWVFPNECKWLTVRSRFKKMKTSQCFDNSSPAVCMWLHILLGCLTYSGLYVNCKLFSQIEIVKYEIDMRNLIFCRYYMS